MYSAGSKNNEDDDKVEGIMKSLSKCALSNEGEHADGFALNTEAESVVAHGEKGLPCSKPEERGQGVESDFNNEKVDKGIFPHAEGENGRTSNSKGQSDNTPASNETRPTARKWKRQAHEKNKNVPTPVSCLYKRKSDSVPFEMDVDHAETGGETKRINLSSLAEVAQQPRREP
ncbi:hypothetical protein RIF29_25302 [Crotalaria pallida]|uniref:Uncharacterized protein n=1 Tax=Crotalaria pallida TaxID=3830 RepID=A0AAN9HZN7_CROPI